MMFHLRICRHLACLALLFAAISQSAFAQAATFGPHLWDQPLDPSILDKRVTEQLDAAQKSISQLLAVKGPRTIENTLTPYDEAISKLDLAGGQSGLIQLVSPDANVRDRAQALVQKVSAATTAVSLNPAIFYALSDL